MLAVTSASPHSSLISIAIRTCVCALLLWQRTDAAAAAPAPTLKIATWNLEWLISPPAFKQLKANCAPEGTPVRGDVRRVPCDVASRFERSSRDFSVLARYAKALDADVVALQETDG